MGIEIGIYNSAKNSILDISLPKTCIRINMIQAGIINSINLENVLYYSDNAFYFSSFPNNTVKIKKNAKYKKPPNEESKRTTFPPETIIEFY